MRAPAPAGLWWPFGTGSSDPVLPGVRHRGVAPVPLSFLLPFRFPNRDYNTAACCSCGNRSPPLHDEPPRSCLQVSRSWRDIQGPPGASPTRGQRIRTAVPTRFTLASEKPTSARVSLHPQTRPPGVAAVAAARASSRWRHCGRLFPGAGSFPGISWSTTSPTAATSASSFSST